MRNPNIPLRIHPLLLRIFESGEVGLWSDIKRVEAHGECRSLPADNAHTAHPARLRGHCL